MINENDIQNHLTNKNVYRLELSKKFEHTTDRSLKDYI